MILFLHGRRRLDVDRTSLRGATVTSSRNLGRHLNDVITGLSVDQFRGLLHIFCSLLMFGFHLSAFFLLGLLQFLFVSCEFLLGKLLFFINALPSLVLFVVVSLSSRNKFIHTDQEVLVLIHFAEDVLPHPISLLLLFHHIIFWIAFIVDFPELSL